VGAAAVVTTVAAGNANTVAASANIAADVDIMAAEAATTAEAFSLATALPTHMVPVTTILAIVIRLAITMDGATGTGIPAALLIDAPLPESERRDLL